MADRLTQLQDAVDQLATQFLASMYYVNKHHDLHTLSKTDSVRDTKKENEGAQRDPQDVEPLSKQQFKDGQRELAQDLITKEQQIELLISTLPGLENSEEDQERTIKQLEEALKAQEEERKLALQAREEILARLDGVIRSIKRP